MVRDCEVLWGQVKGRIARELIEEATGRLCDCDTGGKCPLTDLLPVPRKPIPV